MRRSLDDESYTIRFTPRKPASNWSAVNVAKVEELKERGLMRPGGRCARSSSRSAGTHRCLLIRAQASPRVLPTSSSSASAPNAAAWDWFRRPAAAATAARPPTG